MIIKGTDDDYEWKLWLREYIKERGGIPDGGGNWDDVKDSNGNSAYYIYVDFRTAPATETE